MVKAESNIIRECEKCNEGVFEINVALSDNETYIWKIYRCFKCDHIKPVKIYLAEEDDSMICDECQQKSTAIYHRKTFKFCPSCYKKGGWDK